MTTELSINIKTIDNKLFSDTNDITLEKFFDIAQEFVEDMSFDRYKNWRESTGRKVISTFPVYVPKELIESFNAFAINVQGGGEFLEITHAEAYLGSFICSISKSRLELALIKNIGEFDGFISPYICDVARNLAGVFERNFPKMFSHMLHFPQNFKSKGAIQYLVAEYRRIINKLESVTNVSYNPTALTTKIAQSNQVNELINDLLDYRIKNPACIRMDTLYLLLRVGGLVLTEEYLEILKNLIPLVKQSEKKRKDYIKVLVMGPFCEQPTLEIVQLIEDVGFFIVDSDFQIGLHYLTKPISEDIDPLEALATAYVLHAFQLPTKHNPNGRGDEIMTRLKKSQAEAVIFLTAKFCEPALEDFVLYKEALEKHAKDVSYLHIEFEERSSNFEEVRLQLETLFESILFD